MPLEAGSEMVTMISINLNSKSLLQKCIYGGFD
jgi:hypothetical protein